MAPRFPRRKPRRGIVLLIVLSLMVMLALIATTFAIVSGQYLRSARVYARHKQVVGAILTKLKDQGDLYKEPYKGFYSVKEETFLTEKDRNPDGTWAAQWGQVVELIEENWYFKMGQHQQWLIDYIEANPSFVQPDYRRNEVLGFLKSQPLEDLCITRPAAATSMR